MWKFYEACPLSRDIMAREKASHNSGSYERWEHLKVNWWMTVKTLEILTMTLLASNVAPEFIHSSSIFQNTL